MGKKAFIFDCDGTLINTHRLIYNAWRKTTQALAPDVDIDPNELKKHLGRTLEDAAALLAQKYGVKEYDVDFLEKTYWDYHIAHHDEIDGVYPTVAEALAQLKARGAVMGIVTSGEADNCRKELDELGISEYFDAVIGAEVDEAKPSPKPALLCCEKLGVSPADTVFVGDSHHDMSCGKNAGCTTVLVSWTTCDVSAFRGAEIPDAIIDDAMKLLEYL